MTLNIDSIKERIYKSKNHSVKTDFVAAAIKYDLKNNRATHAGIVICLEGDLSIFHYNGAQILLEQMDPDKWYIDKIFDFIDEDEVPSFYIHCEEIKREANPSYGFNYNGSYFDQGKYYSEIEDFQFMTCVGFCLNVITGAIEGKSYILHEEWELPDHEKDDYFQEHMDSLINSIPAEKRAFLKKNQRRIYPIDYFTSSFVNEIPIGKKSIDDLNPLVEQAIKDEVAKD